MTHWNHWPGLSTILVVIALMTGMILSVALRKLTPLAALTGGTAGWIIWLGAGLPGLLFLAAFFLMGTLATSWKKEEKKDLEGPDSGKRKPGQVFANAGVAMLLASGAIFYPAHAGWFLLLIAASFASATADTLSSELGMVYGRTFINCLSWKKDDKGMDGVISLEGTLIGLAGAAVIAATYGLSTGANNGTGTSGWNTNCLVIVIAGATGNFADSVLGATLERRRLLGNDAVNFLSTAIAALTAALLFLI